MTDHGKLICCLDQVKAAAVDLLHKAVSPNLAINLCKGAAHHDALARRFDGKQLGNPGLVRGMAGHHVHTRHTVEPWLIAT